MVQLSLPALLSKPASQTNLCGLEWTLGPPLSESTTLYICTVSLITVCVCVRVCEDVQTSVLTAVVF